MKVVFARHEQQGKEYLFKVPNHIKKISVCDILAVNTMRGIELAEATTVIQDCSELIATRLGAYLPLKEVYCIMPARLIDICKTIDFVKLGLDLPF